ncbi:MAG: wax ester/triacylglycerol synthase family O-acyltransferase [Gammaproteobacteria bacterium]
MVERIPRASTRPARVRRAAPARPSMVEALASSLGFEGERMSKVDTAWLRMDSEINHMMILGVWILRPGITLAALRERVRDRLLPYRRFVQAAREDTTGAHWADDPDFDLERHVSAHVLRRRRGESARSALQARVGDLAMLPLDRQHPLWSFELIEEHDGGSALIARIHHCIADGIALINVMMSLVDDDPAPHKPHQRHRPGREQDAAEAWLADTLIRPMGDLARLGTQLASDLAALALMPDDTATSLKGQPGGQKSVAWAEPVPLDEIKAVSKAMNCSVNDVLLSCAAGALGRYLRQQGEDTEGVEIRVMVPVNLRPVAQTRELGNHFGLVPLVLPVGMAHPLQRLFEVRRRMNALKGSLQPLLTFGLLSLAGLLVKPAQDALLSLFSHKTTVVMTNVPGPAQKLTFCGATLEQTMFWVPQTGTVGVGISILSYGGGVQFGMIADRALCAQPQAVIDGFRPELSQLLALSLMLPWGEA